MLYIDVINSVSDYLQCSEIQSLKKAFIVCPNSSVADAVREGLGPIDAQVISYGFFLKRALKSLGAEGAQKSKSDLLFLMARVWPRIQKMSGEKNEMGLYESFQIMTGLRGSTLDVDLLGEILSSYGESVSLSVKAMWALIEEFDWLDEHAAAALVKDFLDLGRPLQSFDVGTSFVFYGLTHLTGQQTDLLNKLGRVYSEVRVTTSARVWNGKKGYEWPTWLEGDVNFFGQYRETVSAPLRTLNYENIQERFQGENSIKSIYSDFSSTQDFQSKLFLKGRGRISFPFFEQELVQVKRQVFDHKDLSLTGLSLLFEREKEQALNLFKQGQGKAIKMFKIWNSLSDLLGKWEELSNDRKALGPLALSAWFEKMTLDLPRLLFFIHSDQGPFLRSYSELWGEAGREESAVFIESINLFKRPSYSLPNSFLKAMANIGPIQSARIERAVNTDLLFSLSHDKCTVYIAPDVEEGVISALKGEVASNDPDKSEKRVDRGPRPEDRLFLSSKRGMVPLKKYSASSLQSYLQCPRQFFFHYHAKILRPPLPVNTILPLELGRIQHNGIEIYFRDYNDGPLTSLKVKTLVDSLLESYLEVEGKKCLISQVEKVRWECIQHIESGVKQIKEVASKMNSPEVIFEVPLESDVNGSIDCLIIDDMTVAIIDFKRSPQGVPSIKGLWDFSNIQLLFYFKYLQKKYKRKKIIMGHFCLQEALKGRVYTQGIDDLKLSCSVKVMGDFEQQRLLKFYGFEDDVRLSIESDERFEAKAVGKSTCEFCEYIGHCSGALV